MTLSPRLCRRAGVLAATATALAAAVLPASSGAARRHAAAACPTSSLVAWLDTAGNGAAGTIHYPLHFTNLSGRACTVRGYPGVSPADPAGRSIGPGATRSGMPVRTVTLRNHATATADLGIVEAGNFPPSACRSTTAAGLKVYGPGATAARFVPFPFLACTHEASLRIGPVR
ncbi:MAG TPA: DUF4232 domain-containing protein [Solirubrobacteraceae bacterium]|nr:DUF4232 domain-containing protein [Solirubrobacteraceae bacterium]